MKRFFCGLYLKSKNLIKSIKECNQYHLMDNVIYNGKKCFINNGTRYRGDVHLWDICEKEWNADGTRNCYSVPESELKRVITAFNIQNALFFHYRWYKTYWYKIELDKMLGY